MYFASEVDVLLKRILSSVVGLPALIFLVIYGGWPLKIASFVLIAIAMSEVYTALSGKRLLPVHLIGYLFAAIYMYYLDNANFADMLTIILIAFTLTISISLVVFHKRVTVMDCAVTMFGFFYVAVLMSLIYLVRMANGDAGKFNVWIIFIAAWGCDTGAYFTGITLGRHKLIPALSPKKTVEGTIGGVLFAMVLAVSYGAVMTRISNIRVANDFETFQLLMRYAVIGAGGAVFAQFGDLAASAIKRYTKIKDFGHVIPGHGGVMDRFDSVLFTAPAVYLLSLLIIR